MPQNDPNMAIFPFPTNGSSKDYAYKTLLLLLIIVHEETQENMGYKRKSSPCSLTATIPSPYSTNHAQRKRKNRKIERYMRTLFFFPSTLTRTVPVHQLKKKPKKPFITTAFLPFEHLPNRKQRLLPPSSKGIIYVVGKCFM